MPAFNREEARRTFSSEEKACYLQQVNFFDLANSG